MVEQQAKLEARKKNTDTASLLECSSTIAVPPSSPRDSPTTGKTWDDKYKHNDFELTPDEQRKRAENKIRFNDFLRIEACKRHARRASGANKTAMATKSPQDDSKPKQKKPPVPRLSALARARAQGKTYTPKAKSKPVNCVTTSSGNNKKASKSNDVEVRMINKEGKKYLDFISKKPQVTASEHVPLRKESVSNTKQQPILDDDDSMFRLQLERIVRRASDLVIEKEKEKHTTMKFDSSSSTSSTSHFLSTTTTTLEDEESDMMLNANTKKGDMRSKHDRLNELEMRLARISTSSFISDTTVQQSEDTTSSYYSIGTEVIPRVPLFPMQPVLTTAKGQDLQWTDLNNHLHNDSSSDSDSECDASSFESKSREQAAWQENDNVESYPSLPPKVVEPSVFPTRQFGVEDEPLPRGYDGHDIAEDDFFSLFG